MEPTYDAVCSHLPLESICGVVNVPQQLRFLVAGEDLELLKDLHLCGRSDSGIVITQRRYNIKKGYVQYVYSGTVHKYNFKVFVLYIRLNPTLITSCIHFKSYFALCMQNVRGLLYNVLKINPPWLSYLMLASSTERQALKHTQS